MISYILFSMNDLHSNSSLFYNEYSVILIFLLVAILLSVIIVFLSYILAVQKPETEKLSTYECGFEPYEDARHTFDVKFYLIAILFIYLYEALLFIILYVLYIIAMSQNSRIESWSYSNITFMGKIIFIYQNYWTIFFSK